MSPRQPRGPLGRARRHASRREILVFVEGDTEDGYLLYWRREFRDRVLVTVDGFRTGSPLQLVDRAVEVKRMEARDERRGGGRTHDEIWCVFDRNSHANIPQALDRAAANGIEIVLTNPCIELWFLLHFEDQAAHIDGDDAQRRSRALLRCEKKILTPAALRDLGARYPEARERAQRLDEKHFGDRSPPRSNPSSDMWRLIDRIRGDE